MSVKFRLLPEHKAILIQYFGSVRQSEVLALSAHHVANTELPISYTKVIDLSGMVETDLDFSRIHAVMGGYQRASATHKIKMTCLVFAPSDLAFATSRIFQNFAALSDDVEVSVFRSFENLTPCLGLDDTSYEDLFGGDILQDWQELSA